MYDHLLMEWLFFQKKKERKKKKKTSKLNCTQGQKLIQLRRKKTVDY